MRTRGLGVASTLLALAVLGTACGSEESRLERGATVGEEVAVPSSEAERRMSDEERRAQEERQDERAADERFDGGAPTDAD